ncbi:MAG TPA: hypothetical protein VJ792_03310 [Candidatus Nitrosotalea sp.]|nr:hypothetical protein [Candidatus Nitrosotalea sp.]
MLFKKHDGDPAGQPPALGEILSQTQVNSLLYSDPFLKAGFVSKLVSETRIPVLYLDLDLLYSGYVASGALAPNPNVTIYQPTEHTIAGVLTEILSRASMYQVLVVVDSVNGLFNLLNYEKQVGRKVASVVMLLASFMHRTKSTIVIASMARYRKEEGWVLSPTGKRFIETKNSKRILLEKGKDGIVVNLLNDSAKVVLPAETIPL